ncbi:MAG: hypothetical protein ACLGIT_15595 [Gammaproteobacteria bacterium]
MISTPHAAAHPEAPARLLAMLMSADGQVHDAELDAIDAQRGFAQLGVTRERFAELAREYEQSVGREMRSHNYLHLSDIQRLDTLMGGVRDPALRLRVCALAARLITADGKIGDIERMVFDHMLCRWGLTRSMVSRAILESRHAALA